MAEKLSLIWDGRTKDFVATAPNGQDRHLVFYHMLTDNLKFSLEKDLKRVSPAYDVYNFMKDLEDRGYDLKTLKFSIEKK
jgi:hypothetical protein